MSDDQLSDERLAELSKGAPPLSYFTKCQMDPEELWWWEQCKGALPTLVSEVQTLRETLAKWDAYSRIPGEYAPPLKAKDMEDYMTAMTQNTELEEDNAELRAQLAAANARIAELEQALEIADAINGEAQELRTNIVLAELRRQLAEQTAAREAAGRDAEVWAHSNSELVAERNHYRDSRDSERERAEQAEHQLDAILTASGQSCAEGHNYQTVIDGINHQRLTIERLTAERDQLAASCEVLRTELKDILLRKFTNAPIRSYGIFSGSSVVFSTDEVARLRDTLANLPAIVAQRIEQWEKMRKALEPLAALYHKSMDDKPDDYPIFGYGDNMILVGDICRAREALQSPPPVSGDEIAGRPA